MDAFESICIYLSNAANIGGGIRASPKRTGRGMFHQAHGRAAIGLLDLSGSAVLGYA